MWGYEPNEKKPKTNQLASNTSSSISIYLFIYLNLSPSLAQLSNSPTVTHFSLDWILSFTCQNLSTSSHYWEDFQECLWECRCSPFSFFRLGTSPPILPHKDWSMADETKTSEISVIFFFLILFKRHHSMSNIGVTQHSDVSHMVS